jgi:hypothetical protein
MKVALVITVALLNGSWTAALLRRTGTPAPSHDLVAANPPAVAPSPRLEAVRRGEAPAGAAPSFHWRQLESTDYPTYIANLRAIGCPELTIRDIIIADVRAHFRQSFRSARLGEGRQPGATGAPVDSSLDSDGFSPEERQVLTVLGMLDAGPSSDVPLVITPILASKRARLTEWHRDFTARHDAWQERTGGRVPDPEEMAEFWQILDERQEQLDQMLSPEEREEFDVQNSPHAIELRSRLRDMDVTADEYRALYGAKMESKGASTAAEDGRSEEQVGLFESAATRILGPERATLLQPGDVSEPH